MTSQDGKNEDSSDWNKKIDEQIVSSGILDQSLLNKLAEAFVYDAATTVTWALKKLTLFESRLAEGLSVQVFDPDTQKLLTIRTIADFVVWKKRHFPAVFDTFK